MAKYLFQAYIELGAQAPNDEGTWLETFKGVCDETDMGNDTYGDYTCQFLSGSLTPLDAPSCGHAPPYPELTVVCDTDGCKNYWRNMMLVR